MADPKKDSKKAASAKKKAAAKKKAYAVTVAAQEDRRDAKAGRKQKAKETKELGEALFHILQGNIRTITDSIMSASATPGFDGALAVRMQTELCSALSLQLYALQCLTEKSYSVVQVKQQAPSVLAGPTNAEIPAPTGDAPFFSVLPVGTRES